MKSNKLEKEIASYLKQGISYQDIFKKIKRSSNSHEVARFLYLAGFHKTLILYAESKLKRDKPIPLAFVIRTLTDHNIALSKKKIQAFCKLWSANKSSVHPSLLSCVELEGISPEWNELKTVYINSLKKHSSVLKEVRSTETTNKENKLLRDLDFAKTQGFLKEEERIINALLLKHPNNPKYKEYQFELKEKLAQKILKENKEKHSKKNIISDLFVPEKNKIKDNIYKKVEQIAKKQPKKSKNLSLALYFMQWPDKAFALLKKYPNNSNDIYFLLNWLIETNQYILGLDYIDKILQSKQEDSEILFLMSYKKAQVLYYLGKKTEAKEYLTDILKIKPDYRSAQSLLQHWEENETNN